MTKEKLKYTDTLSTNRCHSDISASSFFCLLLNSFSKTSKQNVTVGGFWWRRKPFSRPGLRLQMSTVFTRESGQTGACVVSNFFMITPLAQKCKLVHEYLMHENIETLPHPSHSPWPCACWPSWNGHFWSGYNGKKLWKRVAAEGMHFKKKKAKIEEVVFGEENTLYITFFCFLPHKKMKHRSISVVIVVLSPICLPYNRFVCKKVLVAELKTDRLQRGSQWMQGLTLHCDHQSDSALRWTALVSLYGCSTVRH